MDRQWIVGVDTDESSRGALIVAKWLASFRARGNWSVRGMHVIRDSSLRNRLRSVMGQSVEERVRGAVAASIADVRAASDLETVDLVHARRVEQALIQSCDPQTLGLLIGRARQTEEIGQIRLGRTARRVLRVTQCPLIIVPPELELGQMHARTLLIATDLSNRCIHAAAFGRWFAHLLDLEPVLVHIARPRARGPAVESGRLPTFAADLQQRRCRQELALWSDQYGFTGMRQVARVGSTSAELLNLSLELDAAWITYGSRPHSQDDGAYAPDLGAQIAAASTVPTIAVPPDLDGVFPWSRLPATDVRVEEPWVPAHAH